MPAIDLLRKMRDSGYGGGDAPNNKEERYFELTPEESQGLKDGQETAVQLTGVFKNGCIYPTEVKAAPPMGADAMPMKDVPQEPPIYRSSVQQVPS